MAIKQLWIGSTGPYLFDRAEFVPSTDGLLEIYQAPLVFETDLGEIVTVDIELGTLSADLSGKEDVSNKVTSLSGSSTNTEYPSAKATWDNVNRRGDLTTNYTTWDSTGHQTMVGNARPWRDELTDALNIRSTGPGVSVNNTESTVEFIDTSQMGNDYCYLNIQLNHDKDLTASIYPHIHFFQAANAAPNFILQYRWQSNNSDKVTSWTDIVCNNLAFSYTGGTLNQIAYSAAITPPSGASLSDIVQFRICRDTDNDSGLFAGNDPYTGTVGFMAFDVHFMINSLGSTDELAK